MTVKELKDILKEYKDDDIIAVCIHNNDTEDMLCSVKKHSILELTDYNKIILLHT